MIFTSIIEGYIHTKYQLSSIYQFVDMTEALEIRLHNYTYCLDSPLVHKMTVFPTAIATCCLFVVAGLFCKLFIPQ